MREASERRTVTDTDSCAFLVYTNQQPTRGRPRLYAFNMKKSLLLIFLLICTLSLSAESTDALILHMISGNQVTYVLDETPVVSFKGEELVITTLKNTVSYQASDVIKFTYTCNSTSMVDDTKRSDAIFKLENDVLHAYNLEPLSKISIYNMEGKLVASDNVGPNGEITLAIPQASGSVLLVKTSVANFRLMKP